jgi:hypothetical protein
MLLLQWSLDYFSKSAKQPKHYQSWKNSRISKRLLSSCSRLYNLLLRVSQSQPIASTDMLNLLYGAMENGQNSLDAIIASLQDIQRNWN